MLCKLLALIPLTERRELDLLKSYDLDVDTDVHDMLEAASKQKEVPPLISHKKDCFL